ncbi:MAG: hypothetical protein LQ341_001481 [Variospora aurantia]|nr:MAG: hypothetical protein LQ341_001481 [Variospora aurantia]
MLRIRRSRLFLILAVFAVIVLYHFTDFSNIGDGSSAAVENQRTAESKASGLEATTESNAPANEPFTSEKLAGHDPSSEEGPIEFNDTANSTDTAGQAPTATSHVSARESVTSAEAGTESTPQEKDVEKSENLQNNTNFDEEPGKRTQSLAEPAIGTPPEFAGEGRLEVIAGPNDGMPKIHWSQLPEHFPIPTQSLIPLPTGKPKAMPTIQHSKFSDESSDQKVQREAKLDQIKKTFAFSWEGYRKNAWMQDELSPVSGKSRNSFCGWGATLVDSLDSLWMLGMKKEFEEATEAVGSIDFTTSTINNLPLFEVTIRYLGGLVAAYDISGSKYRVLLDKAVELAEVLMGAFDTPNRMPMTFYLWKPTFASQPHRAGMRVVLAELGSLSLEFTRLAQITKEARYYDAIARITDEFERWQNNTKMPGLFPIHVDASGCRKPDSSSVSPAAWRPVGPGVHNEQSPQIPESSTTTSNEAEDVSDEAVSKRNLQSAKKTEFGHEKRQLIDIDPASEMIKPKSDCVAQGLNSPPNSEWELFTIGGRADSVYEYLPKEYMLLGGLEEKYHTMYEMAAEATKKNLLFRPMIEDEERNILVAGTVSTSGKPETSTSKSKKLKAEQTHLTCFAGGMFAMGARLFDRKDDIDIAKRLTDGCVWAYEITTTGIMPEHFLVTPCEDLDKCPFNESRWHEKLDPYHPRNQTRSSSQPTILNDETAVSQEQATITSANQDFANDDAPVKRGKTNDIGTPTSALRKRQLDELENDELTQAEKEKEVADPDIGPEVTDTATSKQKAEIKQKETVEKSGDGESEAKTLAHEEGGVAASEGNDTATATSAEDRPEPIAPVVEGYTPPPIPSQEEYARHRIEDEKLPKGVTGITGSRYLLRPEAVESVFIMYRVTGDDYWREKGWKMFTAIQNYTRAEYGASAIADVMSETPYPLDEMESFWLAETLKYLYLLFSEPDYYSLDDYVLYDCRSHAAKGRRLTVTGTPKRILSEDPSRELDDIVSAQCQTHGFIDDALRSYITFVTSYKGEYLNTEYDIARCSFKLLESTLFSTHKDYIRRQIVFSLLEEHSPDTLHLIVALLLFDGRDNEATFEMMNEEGVFPRLIELIQEGKDDDMGLHRMLLELLYEMSRIQRLRVQDLSLALHDIRVHL